MTPENLLAGIIFSSIGLGATIYGKKMGLWKTMVIGIALMAYPYFTADAVLTTLIGLALTAALFAFRD
jgi:predicted phage tail protein